MGQAWMSHTHSCLLVLLSQGCWWRLRPPGPPRPPSCAWFRLQRERGVLMSGPGCCQLADHRLPLFFFCVSPFHFLFHGSRISDTLSFTLSSRIPFSTQPLSTRMPFLPFAGAVPAVELKACALARRDWRLVLGWGGDGGWESHLTGVPPPRQRPWKWSEGVGSGRRKVTELPPRRCSVNQRCRRRE